MARSPGRPERIRERAFHRWVRTHLPAGRSGLLPIGDDAAGLPVGPRRVLLLSSDALVENEHFRRSTPPRRVGEAAAAFNLSDIAAKGGTPAALLIDLLVPPGTPSSWARSVLLGAERMAARYGCHVVGGDTKPSRTRAVVGVSVGWAPRGALPTRRGARTGDLVVTTGVVGRGGAFRSDVARMLGVRPRVWEGRVLASVAHSMTDTSDGLAEAARLISGGSRRRVVLVAEALPLHPRLGPSGEPTRRQLASAFYGGDYELLATVAEEQVPRLQRALRQWKCPLTPIGRVAAGRGAWIQRHGRVEPMPRWGWRHFESRP